MTSSDTIRVNAFDMPRSSSLSGAYAAAATKKDLQDNNAAGGASPRIPPPPRHDDSDADAIIAYRAWADGSFYPRAIAKMRQRYRVSVEPREMAGVYTEAIRPLAGVSEANRNRILVNLHAGGFTFGARLCGQLESVPIASLGGIEVISVDYRLAPEHRHPSAVDDVIAVYKMLLERYEASDIGIFGYSAGALLTAQSIFRMQSEGLPVPGGAAFLSGGATYWGEGDSAHWAAAILSRSIPHPKDHAYFRDANLDDPSVFPLRSPAALARFPTSMLAAGGRDIALSSVVHTHTCLLRSGVSAELHVWEGLGHAFSLDFRLPESEELYGRVVRFFEQHLGQHSSFPACSPSPRPEGSVGKVFPPSLALAPKLKN